METRNSLPKKLILFVLSAAVIGLTATSLWAYDRIGQMPFIDLWGNPISNFNIESVTARYSNFEPYELSRREQDDLLSALSYLRVGLPVIYQRIFSFGSGHVFFTIRTTKGDRTFQIYGWHTDNLNGSYLAYVIIDGVRYNCYDRALIKTLKALEDKYIAAMEAAE